MKQVFHPRAFLSRIRNVTLGLTARTRILQVLEKGDSNVSGIRAANSLSYNVVVHHLRLLESERVVTRKGDKRPFTWALTGAGQQRLTDTKEQRDVQSA